uniref:Alpha-helical ferredoxin n=1 Tax=Haemonchus placei TaxID=6290 RepID=A0A0N4VUV8_HAEPC
LNEIPHGWTARETGVQLIRSNPFSRCPREQLCPRRNQSC